MKLSYLIPAVFVVLASFDASAQKNAAFREDNEYRLMLQRLTERYQDYFIHQTDQKRFEAQRIKGAEALKKKREQEIKAAEQSRQAYIKNRKAIPDDTPLRLKWENEQRQAAAELERNRTNYVLKKERTQKVERSARQIPPEVESGLVPIY